MLEGEEGEAMLIRAAGALLDCPGSGHEITYSSLWSLRTAYECQAGDDGLPSRWWPAKEQELEALVTVIENGTPYHWLAKGWDGSANHLGFEFLVRGRSPGSPFDVALLPPFVTALDRHLEEGPLRTDLIRLALAQLGQAAVTLIRSREQVGEVQVIEQGSSGQPCNDHSKSCSSEEEDTEEDRIRALKESELVGALPLNLAKAIELAEVGRAIFERQDPDSLFYTE
jgi:hypothetical protein